MNRNNKIININGKRQYATSDIIDIIKKNIENGNIRIIGTTILQGGQRLDTLAAKIYGNGSLSWVLAAASNIGFILQTPPGTLIRIPNLEDVSVFIGEE
jgi:hypothetical protein